MTKVVIFAGTTEGRQLTELLASRDIDVSVCVTTEYGGSLLPVRENVHIYVERMDETRIEEFLNEIRPDYCVDATHIYAEIITKNVYNICTRNKIRYMRIRRDEGEVIPENGRCSGNIVYKSTVAEAAEFLNSTEGNIFIATGSKELEAYTAIDNYVNRCTARVLPTAEVMKKCDSLGFCGKNLVCMQGPFSEELNYQMLIASGASWLVTKSAGSAGGFEEKCDAAFRAGAGIVIIGRPKEAVGKTYLMSEAAYVIAGDCGDRCIYLIGTGPGADGLLTQEACRCLDSCDLIIGAERVINIYGNLSKKPHYISYKEKEIKEYISAHRNYISIAVLYSGDIGFYSGAAQMSEFMDYKIKRIPGISSAVYLADRLGVPWNSICMTSSHGRKTNLISLISKNRYVCSLIGDTDTVSVVCEKLIYYGMTDIKITVGERLSYEDECISSGMPETFLGRKTDTLSVVLFENPKHFITHDRRSLEIQDSEFIRGNVPMTKQEIRTVALAKLSLSDNSVIFDVGAGTGSVSVCAALLAPQGEVYAIEKNRDGIRLIQQNARRHRADNIYAVEGIAPFVLTELPAPTHVFIGGSDGRLPDIIAAVREKNRYTRFAVTAVTLETISSLIRILELYPEYADMEIVQVGVARSKRVSELHMMSSENAVYIAVFGGRAAGE